MKFLVAASFAIPLAWSTCALGTPTAKPFVSHQVWVEQSLRTMNTIKVGMTRRQLMKVFTYPDGLWSVSRTRQTFAYRDCPSFLINVEFKPVGTLKPGMRESADDRITKISKPYIEQVFYR